MHKIQKYLLLVFCDFVFLFWEENMLAHQETESKKSYHSLQGRRLLVLREFGTTRGGNYQMYCLNKGWVPRSAFLNSKLNDSMWQKYNVRFLPVFELQHSTNKQIQLKTKLKWNPKYLVQCDSKLIDLSQNNKYLGKRNKTFRDCSM